MSASILQQRTIGTEKIWYLNGLNFTNKGIEYTIIGTEKTGPGAYDTLHSVKNRASGTIGQIEMKRLIQILLESEP